MSLTAALEGIRAIKAAFLVLTALALTGYKWPENATITDGYTCDYVIVGAGTAGSIVANRLSEDPGVTVCLIEAGGDPPLEAEIPSLFSYLTRTNLDWNFVSEDDGYTAQYRNKKNIDLACGKVLGGSSTIDHLIYVKGDPRDYDDWVKASGDDSWSWRNLLPYFKKSERVEDEYILNSKTGKYYGTSGNMGLKRETRDASLKYFKMFKSLGHNIVEDVNDEVTLGYTRPVLSISGGVRQSCAETHLSPTRQRVNLRVIKNTLTTRIIFDKTNRAIGVQCISNGKTIIINARLEVIISAGAFNTPKLLMLSGIGPRQHLNSLGINVVADLPVGENLQDHLAVILIHRLEQTNAPPPPQDPTQFPLPIFIGFGALNKSQSYPDYMTMNAISKNDPNSLLGLCSLVFHLHDDICEQMLTASAGREVLFTVFNLGRPQSRGRILLRSKNPDDPPKIYTGFLSVAADLEKYVDGILDFIKITESSYFMEVGGETMYFNLPKCNSLAGNIREYWKCYVLHMMDTTFHYSSTCAMGTVLDSRLLVRGVTRLRVVDASAMPNLTSGNTKAAVMALAEKAADLIKRAKTCG